MTFWALLELIVSLARGVFRHENSNLADVINSSPTSICVNFVRYSFENVFVVLVTGQGTRYHCSMNPVILLEFFLAE